MAEGSTRYKVFLSRYWGMGKNRKAHWLIEDQRDSCLMWGGYTRWQARKGLREILREEAGPPAPGPTPKETHSENAHGIAWAACALTTSDLGTTEIVLARGGFERNPLIRDRGIRIGIGALACGAAHFTVSKSPKLGKRVAWVIIVARGALTIWNVREAIRGNGK